MKKNLHFLKLWTLVVLCSIGVAAMAQWNGSKATLPSEKSFLTTAYAESEDESLTFTLNVNMPEGIDAYVGDNLIPLAGTVSEVPFANYDSFTIRAKEGYKIDEVYQGDYPGNLDSDGSYTTTLVGDYGPVSFYVTVSEVSTVSTEQSLTINIDNADAVQAIMIGYDLLEIKSGENVVPIEEQSSIMIMLDDNGKEHKVTLNGNSQAAIDANQYAFEVAPKDVIDIVTDAGEIQTVPDGSFRIVTSYPEGLYVNIAGKEIVLEAQVTTLTYHNGEELIVEAKPEYTLTQVKLGDTQVMFSDGICKFTLSEKFNDMTLDVIVSAPQRPQAPNTFTLNVDTPEGIDAYLNDAKISLTGTETEVIFENSDNLTIKPRKGYKIDNVYNNDYPMYIENDGTFSTTLSNDYGPVGSFYIEVSEAQVPEEFPFTVNIDNAEGVERIVIGNEMPSFTSGENIYMIEGQCVMTILLKDNGRMHEVTLNGNAQNATDENTYTFDVNPSDVIDITTDAGAIVVEPSTFTLNVNKPDAIVALLNGNAITLTGTKTEVEFENGNTLVISAKDGFNIDNIFQNDYPRYLDDNGIFTTELYSEYDTHCYFHIEVSETSGIGSITTDSAVEFNVYNTLGIKTGERLSADELKSLAPGLYIINGKKVVINK